MALKPKSQITGGGGGGAGAGGASSSSQWAQSGGRGGVAGGGGGGGGGGSGKSVKQTLGGKETLINDPPLSPERPLMDGLVGYSSPEKGENRFSETDSLLGGCAGGGGGGGGDATPMANINARRSFVNAEKNRSRDLLASPGENLVFVEG